MITLFTPSFADEADTNAQNLSVKEIAARLDPACFAVTMLHEGVVDGRVAARPNTKLLRWHAHGNTLRTMLHLLTHRPDIYFFPREGPLDAAFLAMRKRLRLKTALVSYVVSGGLYAGAYPPARERHIREADAVYANNGYLAELLAGKMGVHASGTIHDGIDRRYYFPPETRSTPEKNLSVLCAGSLRPYKRVSLVVQQAARLPAIRFRIAGTGEEDQMLRDLAVKLGCQNVEFLGHLTQTQLGEQMRGADIFFFPSIVEGHPQVLLQAAGSGLPIIAMRIYRPDGVVDGKTGFLADTDEELSLRLDQLIRNAEMRRSMGEAAVFHSKHFDWDHVTAQWEDAFEKVVTQRRSRRRAAGKSEELR